MKVLFKKVYLSDVPSALWIYISTTLANWGGNPLVGYAIVNSQHKIVEGYIFKSNVGTKEDKVFASKHRYTILFTRKNMNSFGASTLKEAKIIAKEYLQKNTYWEV